MMGSPISKEAAGFNHGRRRLGSLALTFLAHLHPSRMCEVVMPKGLLAATCWFGAFEKPSGQLLDLIVMSH
jgi:hypothetical protein